MKRQVAVVVVFGMLPSADLCAQQTARTSFKVSTRVEAVCEITAGDVSLGNPTAQSASPRLGTTLLRATCTPDTGYRVGLDIGKGTSSGPDTVPGVGTGMTQDHTVFGAVPGSQVVPAEEYGGPITVRVYY